MHLPDRRGRERLLLDGGEDALGLLVVLLLEHDAHLLPRHRGCVSAELRELLLVDLAVLGWQEVDVDEGGHLADLHRGALHLSEGRGHLERRLDVPRLEALLRLLVRADDVGGRGSGIARGLAADGAAELRRASDPALRDLALLLLGLGRRRARAVAQIRAQDLHSPALALALSLIRSICLVVAAHGLPSFPILPPERSQRLWHRIEPHSKFRRATPSGRGPRAACARTAWSPASSTGRAARHVRSRCRSASSATSFRRGRRSSTSRSTARRPSRWSSRSSSITPSVVRSRTSTASRSASTRRSSRRWPSSSRARRTRPACARAACWSTSPERSPSRRCRPPFPSRSSWTSPRWRSTTPSASPPSAFRPM